MPKEMGPRESREAVVDELISQLDMGYKKRKGDKLYLSQQTGIVFGQVEFTIKGHNIVGPDQTEFDLAKMDYSKIYRYLDKFQGGSVGVNKGAKKQFN